MTRAGGKRLTAGAEAVHGAKGGPPLRSRRHWGAYGLRLLGRHMWVLLGAQARPSARTICARVSAGLGRLAGLTTLQAKLDRACRQVGGWAGVGVVTAAGLLKC